MKRALRLASKASGMTSPNPVVGAVLVKGGKIIAEDYHRKPGTPHAEALVIQASGEKAKGATLYVNLEPCCHTDKRTPPCTKAIIRAGIKKVVIGLRDPNPKVSGKGIEELKKAGVETVSGVLEEDARRLNEGYIKYITTGKPFVILKTAMTLDGKIATPEGESKWITGEKARAVVRKLRSSVDAVLTAIGTVKADNPQLTARIKGRKDPIRIVIDPYLEVPMDAKILHTPPETIIVTEDRGKMSGNIERSGIKLITYNRRLDLKWLMEKLGSMEVTSVLIEGGSSLNAHAFEDSIVDKVMFFISPKIIGGRDSFPAVGGRSFRRLADAYQLKDVKVKRVGEDILVEGYVRR
ncbi:MAG: bifunctional diaminohydroxyphosphoribosylaminopyrimidine deaminase/5-amino-6-(5-phosphoribosylamino)uracil reductase RibD [Nitrospirae bacterium]|nr:bifunctional diaminohydroxyphosphoribosylaminopyrimidine deaminase/5-amino-6-(5-phosphoribosylamino)uracil reductase RibD [Nitrospirota bacterium]